MKANVDKLDIDKFVNALDIKNLSGNLDNLKTKVDNFKKISYVVSKNVVKWTKYKKLNLKVNHREKKFTMHFLYLT